MKTALSGRRAGGPRTLAAIGALLAALMLSLTTATPASAAEEKVHVSFSSGDWALDFIGTVRPDGPTGYTYEGYLYASCPPGRFPEPQIALGYGGESQPWEWEYDICKVVANSIHGSGHRSAGEPVAFKVGANSGLFGAWQYGDAESYDIGS